jgi:transcriptional regulator with XRE-family HTH domain
MEEQLFFKENLRFLRNRRHASQDQLAIDLGLTRVKINAMESGRIANPTIGDLISISRFFGIATDTLLTTNLTKLGELKVRELERGKDVVAAGKEFRVLAIAMKRERSGNADAPQ